MFVPLVDRSHVVDVLEEGVQRESVLVRKVEVKAGKVFKFQEEVNGLGDLSAYSGHFFIVITIAVKSLFRTLVINAPYYVHEYTPTLQLRLTSRASMKVCSAGCLRMICFAVVGLEAPQLMKMQFLCREKLTERFLRKRELMKFSFNFCSASNCRQNSA